MLTNKLFDGNQIQLDWDDISYSHMLKIIGDLKEHDSIQQIELRASPSLDGYHVYIETFYQKAPSFIYKLRFDWNDDRTKLCLDMINHNEIMRDILFQKKIKNNIVYEEVKMFKYYRKSLGSEWQLIRTNEPKESIRNT